ncbi:thiamine biosynthesis protein ThiS (plasmid) [Mameliella alba]|uniref:sulfur carrier protein ThiS n=1 Tax=Mameliella alba TaxID=561184 RepID=UPI0013E44F95|nr:sulfur carrier protein ThiS [Mameliella alba]BBU59424.1 thiamine biosynthesis protein ThiS [Mameliella alba]
MQVNLNGARIEIAAASLAALIEDRGFDPASVATAVNGSFVPRPMRARIALAEGDKIEVLSPMQGG